MDLKSKRLFLFDIDGVIRLGDEIIDGAIDLFNHIKNMRVIAMVALCCYNIEFLLRWSLFKK